MILNWSYGVTTVLSRRETLLPLTLASLARAGFKEPRLFADSCNTTEANRYERRFNLPITAHFPPLRPVGNWVTALWELYIREPAADRFALFQDDFVTYPNLRTFLERSPYPDRGYLNLYTFPSNESWARQLGVNQGWFEARLLDNDLKQNPDRLQTGRGAVGLVFDRAALLALLSSLSLVCKPLDAHTGHRKIDGAVVTALNLAGFREYCHVPSLTQHMGGESTMGNPVHLQSETFRGESFDALLLLPKT